MWICLDFYERQQANRDEGIASAKKIAQFCIDHRVLGELKKVVTLQTTTAKICNYLEKELQLSADGQLLLNQMEVIDLLCSMYSFGRDSWKKLDELLRLPSLQDFLFSYQDVLGRSLLQIAL